MNRKIYAVWAIVLTMAAGLMSCSDEESENAAGLSVAAFYPTIVMDGTEVEITGSGLSAATDVVFPGGQSAKAIRVAGDDRIVATAPANVADVADVLTVITADDQVQSRQTIRKAKPAVRYFNPSDLAKTYEDLQIEGNDFLLAESVIFGDSENEIEVKALDFKRKSNSNVTITLPEETPVGDNIPVKMRFMNGEILKLGNLNIEEGEKPGGHWEEKTDVLYSGDPVVMGDWNMISIDKEFFADAKVGDIVRVYIKDPVAGAWVAAAIQDENWTGISDKLGSFQLTDADFERGYFEFALDEELLAKVQSGHLRPGGSNYTLTRVERIYSEWVSDIQLNETVLYDGEPVVMTMDVWGYPENIIVSKEALANLRVGDVIREYIKDPTGGFDTNNWDNRMVGVLRPISSTWVERYYQLWYDENYFKDGYCDYVVDEEFLSYIQSEGLELIGCRHTAIKLSIIVP